MATSRQIISSLNKKVEDLEKELIRDVAKSVERSTRANFNRAIGEVPADDPFVSVSSFSFGKSCAIQCIGNQVLFIEFGAGSQNAQKEKTVYRGDTEYSRLVLGNEFKFIDNKLTEVAPRPSGIVELGEYGKGLGKNDFWVYRTYNGRVAMGDEIWRIGKDGQSYVKTKGIRPIRALWRGVRSGVRKEIARRVMK